MQSILADLAPERSPEELRVATFSLFCMMNWIYTWYRPETDGGPEEVAAQMTAIFTKGLLGR